MRTSKLTIQVIRSGKQNAIKTPIYRRSGKRRSQESGEAFTFYERKIERTPKLATREK